MCIFYSNLLYSFAVFPAARSPGSRKKGSDECDSLSGGLSGAAGRTAFEAAAHEALDQWLDRVETQMSERGSCAPTLLEITAAMSQERSGLTAAFLEALVEAFAGERRHGHFLVPLPRRGGLPQVEPGLLRARPSRSRTVETLLGPVTLERSLFLLRWLSPRVLSAGRSSRSVGAAQAVGRAAGRGQAGAGDAPPARRRTVGRAHRRVDERLCDSRGAATDRVVGRAAGVSGRGRHPGSHCASRRRSQVAAHRGVGHRRGRRAQSSPDRQRHPSLDARRAGLGEGVGRGNTTKPRRLSLLPDRR